MSTRYQDMSPEQKHAANQRSVASRNKHRYQTSENYRASQRRWRHKNWLRVALGAAKSRAKDMGVPFDLTVNDLVVPDVCPVLGIPIARSEGVLSHNSPSIDRFVPNLGYVKGNVAIISYRANRIKYDCIDPKELRAVADYIERGLDVVER